MVEMSPLSMWVRGRSKRDKKFWSMFAATESDPEPSEPAKDLFQNQTDEGPVFARHHVHSQSKSHVF